MGAGFAFMGRQYHIEVSGDDYYIDILMYNAFLHRYLVTELKDTEFIPEYIGKLNFYCSAVDDIICREVKSFYRTPMSGKCSRKRQ